MKYLTFSANTGVEFRICLLVPRLNSAELDRFYVTPFLNQMRDAVLAYDLYQDGKRTSVKIQKEYLNDLLPVLQDLQVEYLVTCDAEYYKTLTKSQKADSACGYVKPCVIPGYEHFHVVYAPNPATIFYDPEKAKSKITQAMTALLDHMNGSYADPGDDIIHFAAYPKTVPEIQMWLQRLLDENRPLSADIEAFSLKHHEAGIGTITFCWSQHEGIAFPVDLSDSPWAVRALLAEFFRQFDQKLLWHNISYDAYVLVYELYMQHMLDTAGLLDGLEILLKNWHDTKLITYLATNSCAGNKLSLKDQAQAYAGNYAQEDIKDITKIPLDQLLEYNLVDGLATWHVFHKHYDSMVADQQLEIYETLFQPAIKDIIQMQLTGLPVDREEVLRLQEEMQHASDEAQAAVLRNPYVEHFVNDLNIEWVEWKNSVLKKKQVTLADATEEFNLNSAPKLQSILYDPRYMNLPVLDYTDSKLPATGAKTLEKLKNHTQDPEIIDFLENLIEFKAVDKILGTFIPAFLAAPQGPDGWHYLFGNFNLGGTVSGRLSSSNPNLQNIPSSGTKWAKAIKKCFKAPPGWLFVGLDFASLEDRISALTTKDPMKLKVYTDGYDGHCLRAHAYFGDQMPDIIPNDVDSVNSIDGKYNSLRQDSKGPTFLLTYGGTWKGMMTNLGWPEQKAKEVDAKYHELYRVSDEWVAAQIDEATKTGYVTVAFGLRVRTPLLHQVIRGTRATPFEAEAEGRTAGNACGQSYGLLNTRAGVEFMGKVRESEYRLSIRPCAHIHDAQYFIVKDDLDLILYMNEHLVKAVEWQEDPAIQHDEVKLGGELSVFYPHWGTELTLPNGASKETVLARCEEHFTKHCGA